MIKVQARVDEENWATIRRRLGAKSNQEAIEFLVRNQLQRWAKADSDLEIRLRRFSEKVKAETRGEGEE